MQSGSLYYQPPKPATHRRRTYSLVAMAAGLLIAGFFLGRIQPHWEDTQQEILDSHLRSFTLQMYISFCDPLASNGISVNSCCLTLLRDTAYSFGEGIFALCADRFGVARR